jgi:cytochrome b6-f complex iron-sulfur subunit
MGDDLTRRQMIRRAALLACLPALAKTSAGCARRISIDRSVSVPPAVDGALRVSLVAAPELQQVGGAVVAEPQDGTSHVLVANTGNGFIALQARCPHAGCDLAWVAEDRQAECPCHGSRFAADGTLLHPPARGDVSAFPASQDANGDVVVDLFAGDGTFKNPVMGGQFSFAIADFPALANVGGAISGRPDGFPTPLIVSRLNAGTDSTALAALSAICTHLGCTVLPVPGMQLHCPCHGSTYALDGTVTAPPSTIDLGRYALTFDGTTVVVSTAPFG